MRQKEPNFDTEPSKSDEYRTPSSFFAACNALYGPFDLDVAATNENRLCPKFFDRDDDALIDGPDGGPLSEAGPYWSWAGRAHGTRRAWCNPPYSKPNLGLFTARARREVVVGGLELVTCLIPMSTSAEWWHINIERPEGAILGTTSDADHFLGSRCLVRSEGLDIETVRVRGRLAFAGPGTKGGARFHSALVTFARPGLLPSLTGRGRPVEFTEEQREHVERLLAAGHSQSNACRLAGVNRRTWYRHKEKHHA